MTLRLSDRGEAALDSIVERTHLSKNAAVEEAIAEMAARTSHADRTAIAFDRVLSRDAEALDRLAGR
jgi:predicted transcriptional regulator